MNRNKIRRQLLRDFENFARRMRLKYMYQSCTTASANAAAMFVQKAQSMIDFITSRGGGTIFEKG